MRRPKKHFLKLKSTFLRPHEKKLKKFKATQIKAKRFSTKGHKQRIKRQHMMQKKEKVLNE